MRAIDLLNVALFLCTLSFWYFSVQWRKETHLLQERLSFCEMQSSLVQLMHASDARAPRAPSIDNAVGVVGDARASAPLRDEVSRLTRQLAERTTQLRQAQLELEHVSALSRQDGAEQPASFVPWIDALVEGGLCPAEVSECAKIVVVRVSLAIG